MSDHLVPIQAAVEVRTIYGCGQIETILAAIADKARAESADVTTRTGRESIASTAYKVARSKTLLDDAGKKLVAEQKAAVAKVDAERKRVRDFLDALKDEVRAPLTAWETERKNADALLAKIENAPMYLRIDSPMEEFGIVGGDILACRSETVPEEYRERLAAACDAAAARVEEIRANAERLAEEQEELTRLRAAEAARVEAERKAREEAEAVERERQRIEAEKERMRRDAERRATEQAAAAEREQQRIAAAAARARAETEERMRREQAAAEAARIEKEQRVKAEQDTAARKAREQAEAAARVETERVETERKRRENTEHRAAVIAEAAQVLARYTDASTADNLAAAIANGGTFPIIIQF